MDGALVERGACQLGYPIHESRRQSIFGDLMNIAPHLVRLRTTWMFENSYAPVARRLFWGSQAIEEP